MHCEKARKRLRGDVEAPVPDRLDEPPQAAMASKQPSTATARPASRRRPRGEVMRR
jgi:hypothetical protein